MKQVLFVFVLFLASTPSFPQTRVDTCVYVLDIEGGTAGERRFFTDNLRMEIAAAGYTLTNDILKADYALSCYLLDNWDGKGRLLVCSLLDAKAEKELASTALLYDAVEETYAMLPYALWSLFAGAPLKQPEPKKEIVKIEKKVPVYIKVIGETEKPGRPERAEPPEGWKYHRIFLNLRSGLSLRYYLAGSDTAPTASVLTFDAGLEPEAHFSDFLALQLGLNFAVDRAEYRRSPSNPSPVVYASSLLSVPLMVKYIFNPSPLTTLGPCLGLYRTFLLLGTSRPPPFGLIAGLDVSVKTGLGLLLFDLRCSVDLGGSTVADNAVSYRRMFLTLSAGYKFGFSKR
ncbi:MAG: PorT family protein [Treponema sp.]|nr:PorT family protein [Treponema sp.]